mmetsp:Transcript_99736/g.281562  ORF Transcript_99736/g.281562 Transcript_99736/m.281562 type:complete len:472 (-) Transcript_99736:90-1505(-)
MQAAPKRRSTMFARPSGTGDSMVSEADAEAPADYGSTAAPKTLKKRQSFAMGENYFPSRHVTWTIEDDNESMGDVAIVVNLLADLSPAGILPLSFGMVYTGYVPSVVLLVLFAGAAAYMMYLVSRAIETTSHKSFDGMWSEVVGPRSAWVPVFTVLSVCFGCCLAYACMFGDLFAGCLPLTRTACLVACAGPLWPLCMLKDLSLLAPTSFGALVAVLYTVAVMGVRCFDGSYADGGKFYGADVVALPDDSHMMDFGLSSLLLVNGLAVAFLCHYNGCKYYREFCSHTPGKFAHRISIAFVLVSGIFACAMVFGYRTFGSRADGVILNSYALEDGLINVARAGMGLANMCSFPLMFSGLREQSIALLKFLMPSHSSEFDYVWFQNMTSTVLLLVLIVAAILVTDASLVVGLVGSICGSATIYVLPCILFHCANTGLLQGTQLYTRSEQVLVTIIGCVGVFLMIAGAGATLAF